MEKDNATPKLFLTIYMENEALLSHQLVQIMDQAQLDLNDIMQIKEEVDRKIYLINSIEIVANYPRYFMVESPGKLISTYTRQDTFRKITPAFSTFLAYANNIADSMHKSNITLIENLPPLYQSIICKSRKNKQEGFRDFIAKIVYDMQYPEVFVTEYIRITTLLYDTYKSNTSLQFILSTLNQKF
nr:hypothetical protein [uncultured Marinifilum sp.]